MEAPREDSGREAKLYPFKSYLRVISLPRSKFRSRRLKRVQRKSRNFRQVVLSIQTEARSPVRKLSSSPKLESNIGDYRRELKEKVADRPQA